MGMRNNGPGIGLREGLREFFFVSCTYFDLKPTFFFFTCRLKTKTKHQTGTATT